MKITGWAFALISIAFSTPGCSLHSASESTLSISLPTVGGSPAQNLSETLLDGNGSSFSTPTSLSDFNCFAINVTGSGIPSNPLLTCSGQTHPLGIAGGMIPASSGGQINVTVPTGSQRTIQLLGFQSKASEGCPSVDSVLASSDQSKIGSPYLLGQAVTNVEADATVEITANFTPGQTQTVYGDCKTGGIPWSPDPTPSLNPVGSNTLAVQVGGNAVCGLNMPCTSVTICEPNDISTATCTLVSDVLIDTSSSGLRLFPQALPSPIASLLPVILEGSNNLVTECLQTASGGSYWGPIVNASLLLGGEAPITTSIQLIEGGNYPEGTSSYCSNSSSFSSPTASTVHYNGILGVGAALQDGGEYYNCQSGSCSAAQNFTPLYNPVSLLSTDNNGVILSLPSVPSAGAPSLQGTLYLGIGTQSNNLIASTQAVIPLGPSFNFETNDGAFSFTSFFSSFSVATALPSPFYNSTCNIGTNPPTYYLCPTAGTTDYTVSLGSASNGYTLIIQNPSTLSTSDQVMPGLSSLSTNGDLIWGAPFFFGKNVFVGLEGNPLYFNGTSIPAANNDYGVVGY